MSSSSSNDSGGPSEVRTDTAPPPVGLRRTYRGRVRTQTWLAALLAGVLILAVVAWVFATLDAPDTLGNKLRTLGVVLVAFVGFMGWQTTRWRWACRRAAAAGGRLCPCCLYPMDSSQSKRQLTEASRLRCPECGESWDAADLAASWPGARSQHR